MTLAIFWLACHANIKPLAYVSKGRAKLLFFKFSTENHFWAKNFFSPGKHFFRVFFGHMTKFWVKKVHVQVCFLFKFLCRKCQNLTNFSVVLLGQKKKSAP